MWLNLGTDVQVISMLAQSSEFGQMQARPWLTRAAGTIKSSWCLATSPASTSPSASSPTDLVSGLMHSYVVASAWDEAVANV